MTDTLPPGPELDALVAEAMGHETRFVTYYMHSHWEMRRKGMKRETDWEPLPAYSTTGNWMFVVQEWLNAKPRSYVVTVITNGFSGYAHIGGINTGEGGVVEAKGKHGPHSLALALLAAVKARKL